MKKKFSKIIVENVLFPHPRIVVKIKKYFEEKYMKRFELLLKFIARRYIQKNNILLFEQNDMLREDTFMHY